MNIQQNTIIEYDGIDSLRKIVRKNGSFFREIHKDTDIGHDSYIEFLVPNGLSVYWNRGKSTSKIWEIIF